MLCPNCAAALSDSAKFCSNCGTPITHSENASPYAAASAAAGAGAAAAAAAPYQAAGQQAQQAAQPEPSAFEKGYKQGYAWAAGDSPAQDSPWADPFQQGQGQPESPYAQPTYAEPTYAQPAAPVYSSTTAKNHIAAGVLAILLGALGVHKFYLGYTKEGVIMLLVTLLTFGIGASVMAIIGIVEGILYLVKTDEEFYYTYEAGNKPWF